MIKYIFLLTVYFGILVSRVQGQARSIDPELFTVFTRQTVINQVLQDKGVTGLSPQDLDDILTQAVTAGSIPQTGSGVKDGADYIFVTGLDGKASGEAGIAEYEVEVESVKDVSIILPYERVVVGGSDSRQIDLALELVPGKSTVRALKYANYELTLIQKFALLGRKILEKVAYWRSQPRTSPQAWGSQPLTIRLYQDLNSNTIFDDGEPAVPWANVKIRLKKISDSRQLDLTPGANQIRFDRQPKNLPTAKSILRQLIDGQSEIQLVSQKDNRSILYKNGQVFGNDFPVMKKNVYELNLSQADKLVIVE